MTHKSPRIAELIEPFRGQELDARYLAYFECFNRQLFFEAHDVLEDLWLPQRGGSNGSFHKGLIQLAGAFVHLRKGRLRPAGALLRLAEANLAQYPSVHERLDVGRVLRMIRCWLEELERTDFGANPLEGGQAPEIRLGTD